MYKCTRCGYRFEGKFCPECGAKYRRNDAIRRERQLETVTRVLAFAPTSLFALLEILLWIFYAIPVAAGYDYTLYSYVGYLAAADALIAFAVIGFALAVFSALVLFLPALGKISFRLGKRVFGCNDLCVFVQWAVLFSLFVTGAYLCGAAGCVGAGIILSFSLIFLFLSAGAYFAAEALSEGAPVLEDGGGLSEKTGGAQRYGFAARTEETPAAGEENGQSDEEERGQL